MDIQKADGAHKKLKPRFTPALCSYLEGMGLDINISRTQDHTLPGEPVVITISILNISDEESIRTYIKEMKKLSKEVCTNG